MQKRNQNVIFIVCKVVTVKSHSVGLVAAHVELVIAASKVEHRHIKQCMHFAALATRLPCTFAVVVVAPVELITAASKVTNRSCDQQSKILQKFCIL